jgi:hypothetical protein
MNTLDLLMRLKFPAWVALLLAVAAFIGMAFYRHLLQGKVKRLQERHKKRLDALDEVNGPLMEFRHAVEHLRRGDANYAGSLERHFEMARTLSRKYESLLGEEFYRAVLKYTDLGRKILIASFTMTDETVQILAQQKLPSSLLKYVKDCVGKSAPVTSARDLIQDLDEESRSQYGSTIFLNCHLLDEVEEKRILEADQRLYQIRETILRTLPSV